ncbi:alpha/beta fold hydrolase [Pseudalkalibacillus caeni]|nr:alpha/beta fold hydrolase [Pseudalkalibacillus caeni]
MKSTTIDLAGQNVHYYEWGKSGKPVLVLLHGLANSADCFRELVSYLKEEYHVFAFDNSGHGRTGAFRI